MENESSMANVLETFVKWLLNENNLSSRKISLVVIPYRTQEMEGKNKKKKGKVCKSLSARVRNFYVVITHFDTLFRWERWYYTCSVFPSPFTSSNMLLKGLGHKMPFVI